MWRHMYGFDEYRWCHCHLKPCGRTTLVTGRSRYEDHPALSARCKYFWTIAYIVVRSPDTDVFLLLVKYVHTANNCILFHTVSGNKRRLIDVSTVGNSIGVEMSNALPAFHAFTGCDTSAFVRRGKLTPLKILDKHKQYLDVFASLGASIDIEEELYDHLEKFVGLMYGSAIDSSFNINKLRYNILK